MGTESGLLRFITLCALIVFASFASSTETAFFSLSRFQLKILKDKYKNSFERIKILLSRPTRLLVLLLLMNEITNITTSSIITEFIHGQTAVINKIFPALVLSDKKLWLITTITSMLVSFPLILLACEITPKIIAIKMNKQVAIFNSKIVYFLYVALKPLLIIVDGMVSLLLRGLKSESKDPLSKTMAAVSEEDFVTLMEEGHREGTVNQDERVLIENVLEFDDINVSEVMTPIDKVFAISEGSKVGEILVDLKNQKYSRIPVFSGQKSNLVGIVHVKQLLDVVKIHQENDSLIRDIMKPIVVMRSELPLSNAFKKFKKQKAHIAACVLRNGGTIEESIGIVTMEDVLESIFGDIKDERDIR